MSKNILNAFTRSRQRTPTVKNFLKSDYVKDVIITNADIKAMNNMGIGRVEDFLLTNQNELHAITHIGEEKAKIIIERAKKYLNKNMPLQSYTQPHPQPQQHPQPHVSNTTEKDVYGPEGRIGSLTTKQMGVYNDLDMWDKKRVNQLGMDIKRIMLNKGKDFVKKILKDADADTVVTLTQDMKLKIKEEVEKVEKVEKVENVLSSQGGHLRKTKKSNRMSRHKYTKKRKCTVRRKQTRRTRH